MRQRLFLVDEVHFLLECPAYEDNRKHLQRSNTNLNRNFVHWPNGLFLVDEVHFLLECPAYEDNRKHLQRSNTNLNRNFVHWPNGFKFNFIMQNKDPSLQLALAKFIKKSLEKRQDLLQIL